MFYICLPCEAWVSVHKGTDKAVGRSGNEELRYWTKQTHFFFDDRWKVDIKSGEAKHVIRNRQYKWLSEQLNIPLHKTHIGMFDVEQCKATIELCKANHININT